MIDDRYCIILLICEGWKFTGYFWMKGDETVRIENGEIISV